jgi:hypothetical protein
MHAVVFKGLDPATHLVATIQEMALSGLETAP